MDGDVDLHIIYELNDVYGVPRGTVRGDYPMPRSPRLDGVKIDANHVCTQKARRFVNLVSKQVQI